MQRNNLRSRSEGGRQKPPPNPPGTKKNHHQNPTGANTGQAALPTRDKCKN